MSSIFQALKISEADSVFLRWRDSLQTASRVISVAVLFYFFDNLSLTGVTNNVFWKHVILIAQFGIGSWAKIILVAGGLVNIAKIAIGEETLLRRVGFFTQSKRYRKAVFFLACIPVAIHFLSYLITGKYPPFEVIAAACNVPLLILLAFLINPFQDQLSRPQRKRLDMPTFLFIILVYTLIIISVRFIHDYLQNDFIVSSLFNFGLRFLELALFIFFMKSLYCRNFTATDAAGPQLILVNPPFSGTLQAIGSLALWLYPPAFIVLKALTPNKYKIKEYNRVLWHDQYYQGNALVGITCLTANSAEAYKIAKEFKKRGSKVVMGGPHVSIFPEEALEFCDSVVIGPAESVWPKIILDYEQGELKPIYKSPPQETDAARVRSYLAEQPPSVIADFLETRRGCKFKCYFCANSSLQQGLDICKNSIEQMVVYLKKISMQYKKISFIDTNFYADPEYMKAFLKAITPFHFRWVASATIDIASDDQTIELLRESGCVGLLIGYEIPADSNESERGGKLALSKKYVILTNKLKKAGIKVKGHFIYGFAKDDFSSLCRLWFFCFKLWPHVTVLSFLTPIPGSAFFEEMVRENRLRDINWRSYNLHALVYNNPSLDNFIYRKIFSPVMLFFLGTTSTIGTIIFAGCVLLFVIAWRFLNAS